MLFETIDVNSEFDKIKLQRADMTTDDNMDNEVWNTALPPISIDGVLNHSEDLTPIFGEMLGKLL